MHLLRLCKPMRTSALQIINQAGTFFHSSTSTGNNVAFNFATTLSSGSFIDFVFGNNGSFASDQSIGAATSSQECRGSKSRR